MIEVNDFKLLDKGENKKLSLHQLWNNHQYASDSDCKHYLLSTEPVGL